MIPPRKTALQLFGESLSEEEKRPIQPWYQNEEKLLFHALGNCRNDKKLQEILIEQTASIAKSNRRFRDDLQAALITKGKRGRPQHPYWQKRIITDWVIFFRKQGMTPEESFKQAGEQCKKSEDQVRKIYWSTKPTVPDNQN